jgi:hypothetical protein
MIETMLDIDQQIAMGCDMALPD